MLLADFLDARTIDFESRILKREQVYLDIIDRICQQHRQHAPNCGPSMLEAILEREQEAAMSYPSGIAIPHLRVDGLADTLIGMTFLQNPLDYDGIKIRWVVLIFTDRSSSNIYLNIVAALLKISQDHQLMQQLHSLQDGHAVINLLRHQQVEVGRDINIADIMVSEPVCIAPEALLSELDSLINEYKISMLPVVDENRNYLGEVHILDVLKVGVPDYLMMMNDLAFLKSYEPLERLFEQESELRVRQIMRSDRKTLSPDTSIIEAAHHMIQERKRSFCVVDKGRLLGVVTAMDIFRKVIKA